MSSGSAFKHLCKQASVLQRRDQGAHAVAFRAFGPPLFLCKIMSRCCVKEWIHNGRAFKMKKQKSLLSAKKG